MLLQLEFLFLIRVGQGFPVALVHLRELPKDKVTFRLEGEGLFEKGDGLVQFAAQPAGQSAAFQAVGLLFFFRRHFTSLHISQHFCPMVRIGSQQHIRVEFAQVEIAFFFVGIVAGGAVLVQQRLDVFGVEQSRLIYSRNLNNTDNIGDRDKGLLEIEYVSAKEIYSMLGKMINMVK